MFVLLSLILWSLRSVIAPLSGFLRPAAPVNTAQAAIELIAASQTHSLVPIHAPTLRHPLG